MSVGEQTRSKDRELIATTSSLVEFLRDVALARRRRIVDVDEYETVLWLDDLPAEVSRRDRRRPGRDAVRHPAAAPRGAAGAAGRAHRLARPRRAGRLVGRSPVLKEKGPAWVVVEQPDGSKGMLAKLVPRPRRPTSGAPSRRGCRSWHAWAARDRKADAVPATGTRRWPAAAHLVSAAGGPVRARARHSACWRWRSPAGTVVRNHLLTTRLIAVRRHRRGRGAGRRRPGGGDPGAGPRAARRRARLRPDPGRERARPDARRGGGRRRWSTASALAQARGPSGRSTTRPVRRASGRRWHGSRRTPRCGSRRRSCCAGASGPA